jgi:DNA invertase Pin-like site-specific DNA recombinase
MCYTYNVCVVVEGLGIRSIVDGKQNPLFKMMSALLSVIAEQERDNIRERCAQGMVVARLAGKKWGRRNGVTETKNQFLNKPKIVQLMNTMKKKPHLTTRELASVSNCSTNLVVKVRKLMPA